MGVRLGFGLPQLGARAGSEALVSRMPAGIPLDGMRQMFAAIQGMASRAGRDPARLERVVRADIEASRDLGAHELLLDACYTPQVRSIADLLDWAERLRQLAT